MNERLESPVWKSGWFNIQNYILYSWIIMRSYFVWDLRLYPISWGHSCMKDAFPISYIYLFMPLSPYLWVSLRVCDTAPELWESRDGWFAPDQFWPHDGARKGEVRFIIYIYLFWLSPSFRASQKLGDTSPGLWEAHNGWFAPDLFWTSSWCRKEKRPDLLLLYLFIFALSDL